MKRKSVNIKRQWTNIIANSIESCLSRCVSHEFNYTTKNLRCSEVDDRETSVYFRYYSVKLRSPTQPVHEKLSLDTVRLAETMRNHSERHFPWRDDLSLLPLLFDASWRLKSIRNDLAWIFPYNFPNLFINIIIVKILWNIWTFLYFIDIMKIKEYFRKYLTTCAGNWLRTITSDRTRIIRRFLCQLVGMMSHG